MTNPTPPGQVPEALRYKIGYTSDSWGERSSTPSGIPCPTGAWVRYEDHAAVIAALRAAHVQNPAEIEHVAGDVSKNGAEVNMNAQQPAPATQPAQQQEAQEPVAVVVPCYTPSGKRVALYSAKQDLPIGTKLYTAPQPSPTAQAADSVQDLQSVNDDVTIELLNERVAYLEGKLNEVKAAGSVPAVDERDDFEKVFPLPSGCIRIGTDGYASTGHSNWAAHTHCERWQGWQARAARAPADSVLGDAARLKARHDFLLWNRSLQPSPIESSVEYSVFDKALELYDAARKQGANHDNH